MKIGQILVLNFPKNTLFWVCTLLQEFALEIQTYEQKLWGKFFKFMESRKSYLKIFYDWRCFVYLTPPEYIVNPNGDV